jgi:tetratricopeptide (TPR) repeat protein
MIYLSFVILGAIALVVYALRRLPYLRSNRFDNNVSLNKQQYRIASRPSTFVTQLTEFFRGLTGRFHKQAPIPPSSDAAWGTSSYAGSSSVEEPRMPISAPIMPEATEPMSFSAPMTDEQPANPFWNEETETPAPLELPTKGLITRRGEAQRIAQELIARADDAFKRKDFKTAETYYLKAAVKDPDNAKIYNRLGVIYLQMKNYKDAVEAFRGALKYDDRVACRHYNIALAYLGKRDYRSAEKGLKEAIRLDPTNEKYRKTLQAIQKQPA